MNVLWLWKETVGCIFMLNLCFNASSQQTEQRICALCDGSVRNSSDVGRFCSNSAGQIGGRCCLKHDNTSDPERIIGLDLSNCSLSQVQSLPDASTVEIIDFSLNPLVNISDQLFQGFLYLNYIVLPQNIDCPGGNTSWEKVELKQGNLFCKGQKNMCNQTGHMTFNCPENSLCEPYGPGFFECSCAGDFRGYKCRRQGHFPAVQVFGPLAASTVVVSLLLWVTQRRKAKSL